jgi:hypothetical protein
MAETILYGMHGGHPLKQNHPAPTWFTKISKTKPAFPPKNPGRLLEFYARPPFTLTLAKLTLGNHLCLRHLDTDRLTPIATAEKILRNELGLNEIYSEILDEADSPYLTRTSTRYDENDYPYIEFTNILNLCLPHLKYDSLTIKENGILTICILNPQNYEICNHAPEISSIDKESLTESHPSTNLPTTNSNSPKLEASTKTVIT